MTLTLSFVKEAIESPEEYPINLEDAYKALELSRKSYAVKILTSNFKEGFDFCKFSVQKSFGRPTVDYFLTLDCFKSLCMMSETRKGKEVREYFIRCEKELISLRSQSQNQGKVLTPDQENLLVDLEIQKRHIKNLKNEIDLALQNYNHAIRGLSTTAQIIKSLDIVSPQYLPRSTMSRAMGKRVPPIVTLGHKEKRETINIFLDMIDALPESDPRKNWSRNKISNVLGVSTHLISRVKKERAEKNPIKMEVLLDKG